MTLQHWLFQLPPFCIEVSDFSVAIYYCRELSGIKYNNRQVRLVMGLSVLFVGLATESGTQDAVYSDFQIYSYDQAGFISRNFRHFIHIMCKYCGRIDSKWYHLFLQCGRNLKSYLRLKKNNQRLKRILGYNRSCLHPGPLQMALCSFTGNGGGVAVDDIY